MGPNLFEGKSAIVTDAAYGLGRHLALTLAEAGARLLLTDRYPEGLRETCERIRLAGGEAHIMPLPAPSQSERLLERARELFGGLDYACFSGRDGVLRIAPILSRAEGSTNGEGVVSGEIVSR